ncbi:ATP-binding protein [Streptomyces sp. NPDC001820]|uniref:ATP-binding protein n=1 Tax=Streptomyces sp. NPDC001820 TaxID=3364613 RepID=UPI00367E69CC
MIMEESAVNPLYLASNVPSPGRDGRRNRRHRWSQQDDFELPHHPEAAAFARERTRDILHRWRVDGDAAHLVLLVVSELVANAVCHAKPQVTVRVSRGWAAGGPVVQIDVADGGPLPPQESAVPPEGDMEERGRGLMVVEAICLETGVRQASGRHMRWAIVSVP